MIKNKKLQKRIDKAIIQIKEQIGYEYNVCFLTNGHPPALMISNLPHKSTVIEGVFNKIVNICFPNIDFDVEEKEFGNTTALVFCPW